MIKICFVKENVGGGGIRTHGTRKRTHAFQACSLSHSDTPPIKELSYYLMSDLSYNENKLL